MELNIRCSTWIREEDEKVLKILQKSEKMLSAEELASRTCLPLPRVQHTLTMLANQSSHMKEVKEFF